MKRYVEHEAILNEDENKRLKMQQLLLDKFYNDVYEDALKGKSNLNILDIGCNNGNLIMSKFGNRKEVNIVFGIEYLKKFADEANEKFGDEKHIFKCCDCESENFIKELKSYMQEYDISSFDVLHISMVLLHLKFPQKLLEQLKEVLTINSKIIIIDIDDDLNIAYPDDEKLFSKCVEICPYLDGVGDRNTGRKIFTYLKNASYKNIELIKNGITNFGLNKKEKEYMFETYLGFIISTIRDNLIDYPQETKWIEMNQWLDDNLSKIKIQFYKDNFYYQLGFMLYTANKN